MAHPDQTIRLTSGTGACDDEGTIFNFDNLNVTEADFDKYSHDILFGRAPANETQGITKFYPSGGLKLPS